MSLPRFYLEPNQIRGDLVTIKNPDIIKQIVRVLRLGPGDLITIFDNSGFEYEVKIMELIGRSREIVGRIIGRQAGFREPPKSLTLYQSLLKSDKFEWVLQKGTELGVARFVPVISENCVVTEISKNKFKRYEEIIREATEQCGGTKLAQLDPVIKFDQALELIGREGGESKNLIAWEGEPARKIDLKLDDYEKINLLVGPEGGYTPAEIEAAKRGGLQSISLGKRILRAETAAVVGVARLIG